MWSFGAATAGLTRGNRDGDFVTQGIGKAKEPGRAGSGRELFRSALSQQPYDQRITMVGYGPVRSVSRQDGEDAEVSEEVLRHPPGVK